VPPAAASDQRTACLPVDVSKPRAVQSGRATDEDRAHGPATFVGMSRFGSRALLRSSRFARVNGNSSAPASTCPPPLLVPVLRRMFHARCDLRMLKAVTRRWRCWSSAGAAVLARLRSSLRPRDTSRRLRRRPQSRAGYRSRMSVARDPQWLPGPCWRTNLRRCSLG